MVPLKVVLIVFFQLIFLDDLRAKQTDENLKLFFSHERNLYDSPFELTITCSNSDALIYFTTDCSQPAETNGRPYSKAILVDSTSVIKAIAVAQSERSKIYTQTYIFPKHTARQSKNPNGFPQKWGGVKIIDADYEMDPEVVDHPDYSNDIDKAFYSLPSLSLTMERNEWFDFETGLYVGYPNSNETREKPVTAEFIFNDFRENFAVECGVQNQGGTSIMKWKVPKQSMRLLFKEIYGPKRLNYKLFNDSEIESINTLVVDAMLNHTWIHPWDDKQRTSALYLRDQLTSDLQNEMGWLSFHGEYYHLFLNGLYWGIYNLHERPDDAFLSEYLDAEREDFDIVKHKPKNVVSGSNESYYALLDRARQGFVTYQSLLDIQEYLDLPAFIDYMILNFYLGNYDWARHNFYAGRNSVQGTGYRFYSWDSEHVIRFSNVNYNNTKKNDEGAPTEIHTLLKGNDEYRLMFADAIYKHMFNDGALSIENFEKSFLFRKNEIEYAIILESARWGDYREDITDTTYTKNEFWIPEVNRVLEKYIPKRRDIVIDQFRDFENRLFPRVMPPLFKVTEGVNSKKVKLVNPNQQEGKIIYTLSGIDPRRIGGTLNGNVYSGEIEIGKSTIVKARFLSDANEWSALAQKTVLFDNVLGEGIVINEIMYNPYDGFPEFIELINNSEDVINLNGFVFTDGIDFVFPAWQEILPGAGLVLSNDTALFRNTYGFEAAGQYRKKLNNGGERIVLLNGLSQVVDSLTYSDTIPWPEGADGTGFSIELEDAGLDNALPRNWKISKELNGTPYDPKTKLEVDASVFPNPFFNQFSIRLKNKDLAFERFNVELFEPSGRKIRSLELISNNSEIVLDSGQVPPGIYILRLTPIDNQSYKQIVLKAVKIKN